MDQVLDREERELILNTIWAEMAPSDVVLDIGCGWPNRLRDPLQARGLEVVSADLYPYDTTVEKQDVRELTYADDSFDIVVCCRVLSNLARSTRAAAISELARVLRPTGLLVLPDTSEVIRDRVQAARAGAGFQPLPPSSSGSIGLTADDLRELERYFTVDDTPIAPNYVIHTRLLRDDLIPLNADIARVAPQYPIWAQDKYAFHRVFVGSPK